MLNFSEYRQRPALIADWLQWAGQVSCLGFRIKLGPVRRIHSTLGLEDKKILQPSISKMPCNSDWVRDIGEVSDFEILFFL